MKEAILTREQVVGLAPISREEFLAATEYSIYQTEHGQTYGAEEVFEQLEKERKAAPHKPRSLSRREIINQLDQARRGDYKEAKKVSEELHARYGV